jgi:hypothetical protein
MCSAAVWQGARPAPGLPDAAGAGEAVAGGRDDDGDGLDVTSAVGLAPGALGLAVTVTVVAGAATG